MADQKISELTELTSADNTDVVAIVDVSANQTKKITVANLIPASSGEANTASNLGAGTGVYASKSSVDLRFKSLIAGTGVSLSNDANTITITNTVTAGETNTASNLAGGTGLFGSKSGVDLQFKSLVAGTGVSLSNDANTVTITNTVTGGETNTASNLGAGNGVYASKSGVDLRFKSLVAGSNISISNDANTITISSSGGGAGVDTFLELDDTPASYSSQGNKLVGVNAGATALEFKTADKTLVGLSNVDNTSDANKPVSTATQTALNAKANLTGGNSFTGTQSFGDGAIERFNATIVTESGTTRTLASTDNGKVIRCTSGSAITITVPTALGAGFNCMIVQDGAGQITFAGSGGMNIRNRSTHTKTAGQYAAASLLVTASNNCILMGDTAA